MSLTISRSFPLALPPRPAPPSTPAGRIPRVTRVLALAIKLDGYVRRGLVHDYAELARLGHVTRARITQIMDLTLLAPEIQEAVLDLPRTLHGRDPIREPHLRRVAALPRWAEQRAVWRRLQRASMRAAVGPVE